MKNFVQKGEVLTVPAPRDVTANEIVRIGNSLTGVAVTSALRGQLLQLAIRGVFDVAKDNSVVALGDVIYADAHEVASITPNGTAIGVATEDAAALTATVPVLFGETCGGAAAVADNIASTDVGKGAALVGLNDAGGYFSGDTAEEALQELGAVMVPRYDILKAEVAGFADANAAKILTLPDNCIVRDVWYQIKTPADAGVTFDVGLATSTAAYIVGASAAVVAGVYRPGVTVAAGVITGRTRGDGLCHYALGTDADDRGLYVEIPDVDSGGVEVHIKGSAADAALEMTVYVLVTVL